MGLFHQFAGLSTANRAERKQHLEPHLQIVIDHLCFNCTSDVRRQFYVTRAAPRDLKLTTDEVQIAVDELTQRGYIDYHPGHDAIQVSPWHYNDLSPRIRKHKDRDFDRSVYGL